jgi:hypothetical protein
MQGDVQVVDYLNRAPKHKLAAVNQYWLHYRISYNWGYKDFAKTWRKESIEESSADQLVAGQLVAGRAIERSLGLRFAPSSISLTGEARRSARSPSSSK